MARYIDAEELVKDIKSRFCTDCDAGSGNMKCIICPTNDTIGEIVEAPTADVVEVVRCGKCKHTLTHTCAITGTKTLVCVYGTKPLAVLPTHFCGYGERRDS